MWFVAIVIDRGVERTRFSIPKSTECQQGLQDHCQQFLGETKERWLFGDLSHGDLGDKAISSTALRTDNDEMMALMST